MIMLSERAEDYLEAIYVVRLKKGYVRVKDVALQLGVRGPSVIEMLQKLHGKRLVVYEKYGGITLTEEGEAIARVIKDRHDTLVRLLSLAGVPADIADKDACTIEHHLSPTTLEQLKKLVSSLEGDRARAESLCLKN
jgi:DtxR family Mn-dependent transcriptional regulator